MKCVINYNNKLKLLSLYNQNKKELNCLLQRNNTGNFNILYNNELIGYYNDKNDTERFCKVLLTRNEKCDRFENNILIELI